MHKIPSSKFVVLKKIIWMNMFFLIVVILLVGCAAEPPETTKNHKVNSNSNQNETDNIPTKPFGGVNVIPTTKPIHTEPSPTKDPFSNIAGTLLVSATDPKPTSNSIQLFTLDLSCINQAGGCENALIQITTAEVGNPDVDYYYGAISPNGKQIAYISTDISELHSSVHHTSMEADTRITIAADGTEKRSAAWSYDSSKLAYISVTDNGSYLNIINSDGCCVRRGPRVMKYIESPVWSPIENRLVFVASDENITDKYTLFSINSDGRGLNQLTEIGEYALGYPPSWSPDGKMIAISRWNNEDVELCLLTFETGEKICGISTSGDDVLPIWAPDNSGIVFLSISKDQTTRELYFFSINDDQLTKVPINSTFVRSAHYWFPDTNMILVSIFEEKTYWLFIVDLQTGRTRKITYSDFARFESIWTP